MIGSTGLVGPVRDSQRIRTLKIFLVPSLYILIEKQILEIYYRSLPPNNAPNQQPEPLLTPKYIKAEELNAFYDSQLANLTLHWLSCNNFSHYLTRLPFFVVEVLTSDHFSCSFPDKLAAGDQCSHCCCISRCSGCCCCCSSG